jgi:hypothetical protein
MLEQLDPISITESQSTIAALSVAMPQHAGQSF